MNSIHQKRVAEQIRTTLSELFLREMKDPRLQGLTVTSVTIDREIQFADVYVHAMGEDEREEEMMATLRGAAGFLRREVGNVLGTRTTPVLRFHWDPTFAYADHIDRLLDGLEMGDDDAGEGANDP